MKIFKDIYNSYKNVFEIWRRYWRFCGGIKAVLISPYFHLSIVLTFLNYGSWWSPGWWDLVISTVPTILGFTLAGLAVFLGMDSGFSRFLASDPYEEVSPLTALVTAFVHFVITQAMAVLLAITMKSANFVIVGMPEWYYDGMFYLNKIAWFLGFAIYMYAMLQIFSATFAIFRATGWYQSYIRSSLEKIAAIEHDSNRQ